MIVVAAKPETTVHDWVTPQLFNICKHEIIIYFLAQDVQTFWYDNVMCKTR